MEEKGARVVVEPNEVGTGLLARIGGEEVVRTVMSIAPDEDVADGMPREDGCEGVGPPVARLQTFVAGLGKCDGLVVLLGNGTDHRQILVECGGIVGNLCRVGLGSPAVAVESQQVDDVVTGIAFQIFRLVAIWLRAR